jgi:hypothetical protein
MMGFEYTIYGCHPASRGGVFAHPLLTVGVTRRRKVDIWLFLEARQRIGIWFSLEMALIG